MTVEFDTPAARVIEQFSGKDDEQFRIPVNLPDITFLRALSIQGRLRFFQGSSIGAGTPITITPVEGETMFFYRAVLSATSGASIMSFNLINDGQTRASIGLVATSQVSLIFDFIDSLVGNSIKTFRVTNDANNASVSILAWVENTSRIRDVTI